MKITHGPFFCSSVFISVCVFNVWPKTASSSSNVAQRCQKVGHPYFRARGREGERESEKHRCERETSISCLLYTCQGTEPATQVCALTGNRTSDLSVCGTTPNQLKPHRPALSSVLLRQPSLQYFVTAALGNEFTIKQNVSGLCYFILTKLYSSF